MADPTPFHVYQASPGVIPAWRAGEWGTRWEEALGLAKDGFAQGATDAVRARFLTTAPDDAVGNIGSAFDWPRGPTETVDAYRTRLRKSWCLAQWRGTRIGMVAAFDALGMPNVEVKEAFTPGWGRADGAVERQRWLWIVVRHPHPFGTDFTFRYGDGTNWGEKNYGSNAGDSRQQVHVRHVVRQMKPAHCFVEWIAFVLAGDIIDGTDTTADGDPDGASSRVLYLGP